MKKVFETFDYEHNGTIRSEDWNKIYRVICKGNKKLAEWEIRVLQRRFRGQTHGEETIDYARLIMFLLDFQQRQVRKRLQTRVVQHFQQQFTPTTSTGKMEKLFQALDTDKKGYFNAADLKAYLTKEFVDTSENEGDISSALLSSADALASVMCLLAGGKSGLHHNHSKDTSGPQTVVTFERFRKIASAHKIHLAVEDDKHTILSFRDRKSVV